MTELHDLRVGAQVAVIIRSTWQGREDLIRCAHIHKLTPKTITVGGVRYRRSDGSGLYSDGAGRTVRVPTNIDIIAWDREEHRKRELHRAAARRLTQQARERLAFLVGAAQALGLDVSKAAALGEVACDYGRREGGVSKWTAPLNAPILTDPDDS